MYVATVSHLKIFLNFINGKSKMINLTTSTADKQGWTGKSLTVVEKAVM